MLVLAGFNSFINSIVRKAVIASEIRYLIAFT